MRAIASIYLEMCGLGQPIVLQCVAAVRLCGAVRAWLRGWLGGSLGGCFCFRRSWLRGSLGGCFCFRRSGLGLGGGWLQILFVGGLPRAGRPSSSAATSASACLDLGAFGHRFCVLLFRCVHFALRRCQSCSLLHLQLKCGGFKI